MSSLLVPFKLAIRIIIVTHLSHFNCNNGHISPMPTFKAVKEDTGGNAMEEVLH
jgi:hypothetical protein